jgi:DNA gyrase subunit B
LLPRQPLKLHDCTHHGIGSGAELYVVEGDSAAGAVERLRNADYQAVLPLQGKPLNTARVSQAKVLANPWFKALVDAIGAGVGDAFDASIARYDRVILLMDPDADGIHIGALTMVFFQRWMRPWLDAGRLGIALAPVATVTYGAPAHPEYAERHAHSEHELRAMLAAARAREDLPITARRYRGLAGTDLDVLEATCLVPGSRVLRRVTAADVEAMGAMLGVR